MEKWSVKMADSVMARQESLTDKWTYDYGVILKGFEAIYENTGEQKYLDYIIKTMDFFVNEDGSIKMYSKEEYNIDHVNNGKLLALLYKKTGQEKYRKAADLLMSQLETHPRTSEGAFWHKNIYPYQIWLDGLYMGSPFYAEYIKEFADEKNFDDVTKQFLICEKHTKDKETGLLYHAWDESREMFWCDKETGLSENFWGRSLGWFVMAIVDVLDHIPTNHKDYQELINMLNRTMEAIVKYQDKETGVWYQVVTKEHVKGNYIEASASSMMVYALAKGIDKKYLDEATYMPILKKAYQGVIDEFITITNEGLVNLNKVCQVSGLGGADKRDGSFAYYISEPIIANDPKGVGAFLNASAAVEKLLK